MEYFRAFDKIHNMMGTFDFGSAEHLVMSIY